MSEIERQLLGNQLSILRMLQVMLYSDHKLFSYEMDKELRFRIWQTRKELQIEDEEWRDE